MMIPFRGWGVISSTARGAWHPGRDATTENSRSPVHPVVDRRVVTVFAVVWAQRTDLTNAAGNGDSGGPVFRFNDDLTGVVAKGTYSMQGDPNTYVTCTGIPGVTNDQPGRHCSYDAFYASISDTLSLYAADLVG
jgi:hypothetical protein